MIWTDVEVHPARLVGGGKQLWGGDSAHKIVFAHVLIFMPRKWSGLQSTTNVTGCRLFWESVGHVKCFVWCVVTASVFSIFEKLNQITHEQLKSANQNVELWHDHVMWSQSFDTLICTFVQDRPGSQTSNVKILDITWTSFKVQALNDGRGYRRFSILTFKDAMCSQLTIRYTGKLLRNTKYVLFVPVRNHFLYQHD